MKIWEFAKVNGSKIKVDNWMSDTMGLVDGGCVYSTLFKHPAQGPKDYEIILSMFPQENYRTLTHITMYLDDVPGSSAQAADFLAKKGINILNSISLNGISDTVIVWKLMADLNFAGESDLLLESFENLKARNDESVSKIKRIDIKPAEIGRLFKGNSSQDGKEEIKRGYPTTIDDGCFDVADVYGDVLKDIDGKNILITMDADSWILSLTLFKSDTHLVKVGMEIPDCPGSITQALSVIAGWNVNLISVFSKVKICYQTMYLELVMDIGKSDKSAEQIKDALPQIIDGLKEQICAGVLPHGQKLPSVRELASQLAINPNTIQRAYRQLEMDGWIATVPGKGCFVCGSDARNRELERWFSAFDEAASALMALGIAKENLIDRIGQGGNNNA